MHVPSSHPIRAARRTAGVARAALLAPLLAVALAACSDSSAPEPEPRTFRVTGAYGAPRWVDQSAAAITTNAPATSLPAHFVCPVPDGMTEARAAAAFTSGTLTLYPDGSARWEQVAGNWYRSAPTGGMQGATSSPFSGFGRWREDVVGTVRLSDFALPGVGPTLLHTPAGAAELPVTLECPGFSGETAPGEPVRRTVTLSLTRIEVP